MSRGTSPEYVLEHRLRGARHHPRSRPRHRSSSATSPVRYVQQVPDLPRRPWAWYDLAASVRVLADGLLPARKAWTLTTTRGTMVRGRRCFRLASSGAANRLANGTTPRGFGSSDTAFRNFVLMAPRRLESDRFLTVAFTPEVHTPEGLRCIEGTTMSTVLLRHYPELAPAPTGTSNAFAPPAADRLSTVLTPSPRW